MTKTTPEQNKVLVLEAFDTLLNKRDYEAAAPSWSENYIQHSAHIEPGRDGLFKLIRSAPETLRYEHQLIVAESDYVIVYGRSHWGYRPDGLRCYQANARRCWYGRAQGLGRLGRYRGSAIRGRGLRWLASRCAG
jgi:hypothetical protein